MALGLAPDFHIAVKEQRAFVTRTSDGIDVAALAPIEVHLLGHDAGTQSIEQTQSRILAELGLQGWLAFEHLMYRLLPLLGPSGGPALAFPPSGVLKPHPPSRMRALPGPKILHWSVTHRCPRRCVYCFAEPVHGSAASDSTFPRNRLAVLLIEAASLGATGILLSGSEPLLRPDLPEIIGDARRAGLEVLLTTKHPISADVAARLAGAGLASLSLSVDTMDEGLSRKLVGSAAYPGQVRTSVANLRRAGVGFSIQAVLTPETSRAIDGLMHFAAEAGAAAVQLVPFERVRRPIAPVDQSSLEVPRAQAELLVLDLRSRFAGLDISLFEKGGIEGCDDIHCDIGATKMFFTPAGRVHRCYKLTHDRGLDGADLNIVSIAAAWHDSDFNERLLPDEAEYAETPCDGCGHFGRCHSSGRCIFEAKSRFDRYAAPDRACARADGAELAAHP